MPIPEGAEEILVTALIGVEDDADNLRVAGVTAADSIIRRVVNKPLSIPYLRFGDSGDSLESQLHAPEAAGTELGELLSGRGHVIVGALSNARAGRSRCRSHP